MDARPPAMRLGGMTFFNGGHQSSSGGGANESSSMSVNTR
jgi:hypothetical protein